MDIDEQIWWAKRTLQAINACVDAYWAHENITFEQAKDVRNFSQKLAVSEAGKEIADLGYTIAEYPPYLRDLTALKALVSRHLSELETEKAGQ